MRRRRKELHDGGVEYEKPGEHLGAFNILTSEALRCGRLYRGSSTALTLGPFFIECRAQLPTIEA